MNKTTTITVDPQGQPLTITDPLSNVTTFTYEAGDLIKVKDPLKTGRRAWLHPRCPVRLSGGAFPLDSPPDFTLIESILSC